MGHMKKHTLEDLTDKYVGKQGSPERERFDFELKTDLIGEIIKKARVEQNLTQEQLGKMIGVQKAQISKIENNTKDVRFSTILKVLEALKAKVNLTVELDSHQRLKLPKNHFQTVTICHGFIAFFFQPFFQLSPVCLRVYWKNRHL